MADSDYGSTITKGGIAIGRCQVIDFPELTTAKIDITNHAGNGWSEGIPSGLIVAGDITLMILVEGTLIPTVIAEMLAKTVSTVIVANPVHTLTFQGFYLSLKMESADAQAPNAVRATTVLTPSGEISVV